MSHAQNQWKKRKRDQLRAEGKCIECAQPSDRYRCPQCMLDARIEHRLAYVPKSPGTKRGRPRMPD